jgi:uncharacterized membrane protein YkvA (DUF1232 family)
MTPRDLDRRAGRTRAAFDLLVHLPNLLRLYWRLLRDARVPLWPKAMLVAALVYVVLPFDIVPDALPLLGQVDDVVILVAAARWFIRWCPADVVREHVRTIDARRAAAA